MGCVFCATGQMGFSRHLRPGEIVAQVLHARDALASDGKSVRAVQVTLGPAVTVDASSTIMTTDRKFGSAWDVDRATGRSLGTEPGSARGAGIGVG